MKFDESNVEKVCVIFENCESLTIPNSSFKKLEINLLNKNTCELEMHIVDDLKIIDGLFDEKESPIARLAHYTDITMIDVKLKDKPSFTGIYDVVWNSVSMYDNKYKENELISYREVKVSINKNNKKILIEQVLDLPIGTIIVDEDCNEYKVDVNEGGVFLSGAIVSEKILKSKFILKNN